MGWRANLGWLDGDAGHVFRPRPASRPLCGQRRWSGSHAACVCLADHEGPHESAEGDQWEEDEGPPPDVVEAWARGCRCCPQCWACPCDACCAGGMCDSMPCRCEDEADEREDDHDADW